MTVWHKGKITAIKEIAPEVRSFSIVVPAIDRFDFEPGQFITLDLPISEKRLKRWRSYSIASAPDGTNIIELCIVRNAQGLGTNWLFDEAKVGTELTFKGPDGAFVLPKGTNPLVMVCTGTGVAPFRSMLKAMAAGVAVKRPVHLIFGTRHASGILYRAEFEALKSTLPEFSYDIALSRGQDPDLYHGYVHQVYLNAYAIKQPDIKFMLCGWTNMVDEAVAHLLVDLEYDRAQVVFELYG
jgi:ferredoxin-NADP reductase